MTSDLPVKVCQLWHRNRRVSGTTPKSFTGTDLLKPLPSRSCALQTFPRCGSKSLNLHERVESVTIADPLFALNIPREANLVIEGEAVMKPQVIDPWHGISTPSILVWFRPRV